MVTPNDVEDIELDWRAEAILVATSSCLYTATYSRPPTVWSWSARKNTAGSGSCARKRRFARTLRVVAKSIIEGGA